MSEPMSHHEIEDVLSSIRRLVSEDLRPPAPAVPGPMPEIADKLMLTPALRVVSNPDEIVWKDRSTGPEAPVEDVVARLGAAVAEEEWESPFGDPEVWPGAVTTKAAPEFEPALALTSAEPSVEDVPPEFMAAPRAGFAEIEETLDEPAVVGPAAVAPEVSALRTPVREVSPPQDDSAWEDAGWADEAEAAVRADLAQETEDDVISGLYDAQAGGMAFDEEVLRDLVRDLIREELSGTLGERITRNVRKLVRAEIARAMALREFE